MYNRHGSGVGLLFVLQLIEAEWRINVSVNQAIIGSDNGLSPLRYQAITLPNAEVF